MTNHWNDIANADVIMIIGANPAENHPMSFRHITKAVDNNNARLICVDPRFTRSASKAHVYAPIRSGTDIAFIDGMINYVLQNQLYNEDYVLWYSNAGFILRNDFRGPGTSPPLDGIFSGFTAGNPGSYSTATWQYCKSRLPYTTGTVTVDNDPVTLKCRMTGSGTAWSSSNMKVGDLITITTGGDPDAGNAFKVVAVAGDYSYLDMERAATGSVPRSGLTYGHSIVPDPNMDIVKDFWDANGDCKVHGTSCGWSRSTLTLATLGAWRQHLAAAGMLPANAGLTSWEETEQHMARYTPALVSSVTGCPQATLLESYGEYAASGASDKSAVIMYAMGTTQHTVGTQNIRSYSILQILLGNMGVAGGGIAAMRGESNVQGSTDWGLLYHILTSYLKVPSGAVAGDATVGGYLNRTTPKQSHTGETNWWGNTPKYFLSFLANMWDDLGVGAANSYCDPNGAWHKLPANAQAVYDRLPKIAGNHSHIAIFERMAAGGIKGLLCFGQNPAVGGPNSKVARTALRNLDWLVVSELWEQETAAFWQYDLQGNPLDAAGKAAINTEVFLLPAAAHMEKEGTISNSSRWAQFRYKAVEPPGGHTLGARHEIQVVNALYDKIRARSAGQPNDLAILNLNMGTHWYGTDDPKADVLDAEINGYARAGYSATFGTTTKNYVPGNLIDSFAYLPSNGAASCAGWVYCGMYTGAGWATPPPGHGLTVPTGTNKSKLRSTAQTAGQAAISLYPNWSWCWPVNRRIIYNRASVNPTTGAAWDAGHALQSYAGAPLPDGFPGTGGAWTCNDVIDGGFASVALGPVKAPWELGPYIMQNEGHCRLFGGFSMTDGPFPEHYEPLENPFGVPDTGGKGPNPMGHNQQVNPVAKIWRYAEIGDVAAYPIVATTYRVSEHWQAGAQTRNLPWLCELVPNIFCEMSQELAASLGVSNGDRIKVLSMRGKVKCYALVTDRFKPFTIDGRTVHQVGVIWHFGYKGLATGHSGNLLTPHVGCANTTIPEYKAFRCKVVKV